MRRFILMTAVGAMLAACVAPSEPARLPEGAMVKNFTYQTNSIRRGVIGNYNTIPKGRPPAILLVNYQISCLSDETKSAEARYETAKSILKKEYMIAPLSYDNPRERRSWQEKANDMLMARTNCQVNDLRHKVVRKIPVEMPKR